MIWSWVLFLVLAREPLVMAPIGDYGTQELCQKAARLVVEKGDADTKAVCLPIGHIGI